MRPPVSQPFVFHTVTSVFSCSFSILRCFFGLNVITLNRILLCYDAIQSDNILPSIEHRSILVHGQVTIIFVVCVGLSVCLFVCAEFFSAVFDPISIKLGHMLYVWF